jgi:ADP-ribose pyrophosphatase YjhB (NUDIX family)
MELLKKLAGKVWRKLPQAARRLLIRTSQIKFTVSVTAVILNDEGKILLLDHVLRPKYGWGTPGGFIGLGEQPEAAIRRELQEEIGLELRDLEMAFVRTIHNHVEIVFRARGGGELKVGSVEIHSAAWFSLSEMPAEMSAMQKFVIEKALS